MKIKKLLNRWTTGVLTAVIITAGSLALSSLATEEQSDTPPIVTTMPETTSEQKEKIYYEYYTITEEAVKNGWTCQTIHRCDSVDSKRLYVYNYDPAVYGKHKFTISSGIDIVQLDFIVVFVDEYNNFLGEETYTLKSDSKTGGFSLTIEDYPAKTKYVKFKDITNVTYPDRAVNDEWECNLKECVKTDENGNTRVDISKVKSKKTAIVYFGFDVVEFDIIFIYVDENEEETEVIYNLSDYNENTRFDWKYRKYYVFLNDFPEGVKYVKFKDVTNIIKKDS